MISKCGGLRSLVRTHATQDVGLGRGLFKQRYYLRAAEFLPGNCLTALSMQRCSDDPTKSKSVYTHCSNPNTAGISSARKKRGVYLLAPSTVHRPHSLSANPQGGELRTALSLSLGIADARIEARFFFWKAKSCRLQRCSCCQSCT